MHPLSSVDLEIVLSLAAVFWLHGWRRTSGDGLVAVHAPLLGWRVREPFGRIGPFVLATWWPALIASVYIAPDDRQAASAWQRDFTIEVATGRRHLRRVRWFVLALRALGTLHIVWMVVAVPVSVARFGVSGLLLSLAAVLPQLLVIGLCTGTALRRLGCHTREAVLTGLRHSGPFSAPFAAEPVIEQALARLGAPARLASLLGEQRFLEWIRPWAFDARQSDPRAGGGVASAFVPSIPAEVLDRATSTVPRDGSGHASRYCPRCASAYVASVSTCSACDGVPLVEAAAARGSGI